MANLYLINSGLKPHGLPGNWRFEPKKSEFVFIRHSIGKFFRWIMGLIYVFWYYPSLQIAARFPVPPKIRPTQAYRRPSQYAGSTPQIFALECPLFQNCCNSGRSPKPAFLTLLTFAHFWSLFYVFVHFLIVSLLVTFGHFWSLLVIQVQTLKY